MSTLAKICRIQNFLKLESTNILRSSPKIITTRYLSDESKSNKLENVDTFKCLNRVTLLGRAIGPATTSVLGQTEMASFTLATNELHRNKANELIKRAEFHRIQIFNPRLVNRAKQVVQKGSRILVEGKIKYNVRKNEQGATHFTNITADNIVFITGSRPESFDVVDEVEEIHEEESQEQVSKQ